MPSADLNDSIVVFTDASATSISGVLCQHMRPLNSKTDKKELHIVGCWSSTLQESWLNYPIWLLELISLWETTRKFKWLLSSRVFWAVTDSSVVTMWASLDAVPKDLARKILSLQRFQYRILFISGELTPADCFSRDDNNDKCATDYPRFLRD